jgi:hypothetical protein
MVSGLRSLKYEDRLCKLGLTTLEERRHPADMLQMFKIINGAGDLQITDTPARRPAEHATKSQSPGNMPEFFLCERQRTVE